ncbi:hypothetical protein D5086_022661, partial [Populus alba]
LSGEPLSNKCGRLEALPAPAPAPATGDELLVLDWKFVLIGYGSNKEGQSTQGDIETELANVGWISFSEMEEAASTILSMTAATQLSVKMVAQEFTVDLDKPLVFQVGHLGEAYEEWVHQPIVGREGPRFFESDFMESLTRTVWWAIPSIWLPVICYFVLKSVRMGHTLPEVALIVVGGVFIWTLLEYTLHRFLFHIKTKSYWGNTMHYLLHGCHHKHPMDGLRLVFPPAATAILLVPFWNMVKLFSTPSTTPALFGGGLLGYVIYDCTHYYLHHGQPANDVPKNLKKYHMNHHFRVQDKGFGITSSLWDRVFGTFPPSKAAKKI